MLVKDKIILIFYLNISHINRVDIITYLDEARLNILPDFDESAMVYFVPVEDEDSHVECINPKIVDEKEYEIALEKLNESNKKLDEFLKKINNNGKKEE